MAKTEIDYYEGLDMIGLRKILNEMILQCESRGASCGPSMLDKEIDNTKEEIAMLKRKLEALKNLEGLYAICKDKNWELYDISDIIPNDSDWFIGTEKEYNDLVAKRKTQTEGII